MKPLSVIFTIVIAVILSGCTVSTYEPLKMKPQDIKSRTGKKLDYTCRFLHNGEDWHYFNDRFKERLEADLKAAGMFAGFGPGSGAWEYHLDLEFSQNNSPGATAASLLTALTLGLIPSWADTDMNLKVTVTREGKTLKEYQYANGLTSWHHLFLIFVPSQYGYEDGTYAVLDDMILRFFADAQKDRLFDHI